MREAGAADEEPDTGRAWPLSRYLVAVVLVTAAAIGALGWARPSVFTSPLVVAGAGRHFAEPRPDSFYAVRVAPILQEQCAGCHGPRLQRARLRLDTLGDLTLGGKSGRVVVAGDPHASELYTRLLLPEGDRRAMPAGNKPPLTAAEKRVIELWIASGASGRTRVDEIANAPPPPSPPVTIDAPDADSVAKARAPLEARVKALAERYPGSISYLSRASADLSIDVQRLGASFGDEDLAQFAPVAAAVTRLDLSGTAISDASVPTIAAFGRLTDLRLNGTDTGDAVLAALSHASGLKALTVIDTNASPARIAELRGRGVRVYDARD
jgi:hypothetical protein